MADGPWPGGAAGAVSVTFDDGLPSQRERAVPLLEAAGLRATFYLNPRGGKAGAGGEAPWAERLEPWRAVAASGHELGNHTVGHPCAANFGFAERRGTLEGMTLAELAADIDLAEARLRHVAAGGPRSFAYPCYQDSVGEGTGRQSYVPLVAARFVAARTRGERPNHPGRCDLHHLWSWPAERMSGAELIGLCEEAACDGMWGMYTFHGVGEGHLPVGTADLTALCAHLERAAGRIWTAPVAEVARHLQAGRLRSGPQDTAASVRS